MSTQLPDITARLRLDTTDLDRGLGRAHGSMRRFAGVATAAIGGIGFAAAVKGVAQIGIAYQDSLNIFQSVSGANAAQMAKVGAAAKQLGNDLSLPNTSAADAATAMTELAKAGLSVDDALAAGKGTLQLAAAGAVDEGTAAKFAANALNTFRLKGNQASKVANVLANAANISSGEVSDFADGLAQSGLVAKQFGLSLEDTTGTLALFANNGLRGSDAGTSLKTALLRLEAPTDKVQGLMQQLGINVRDSHGNMKPLADIAQVLQDRMKRLSSAQRDAAMSEIFGQDAIRAGTLLYDAGRVGIEKYTTAVGKAGGAADIAAARSKGLGGAIKGLQSTAETISLQVFEKIAPSVERGVRKFTEALPRITAGIGKAIGSVMSAPITHGVIAALSAGIGAFTGILPRLLSGVGDKISQALSSPIVKGIMTPLNAALTQAKAALLDFFGVQPQIPVDHSTKLDRINRGASGPGAQPTPLSPAQQRAGRADRADTSKVAPFALPGSAVVDQKASDRIADALVAAVKRIDAKTLGKNLGELFASALTTVASASAQLTVALGQLIEKVDFAGLAVKLGKKAPAILLGLAIGILNFDPAPIFAVLKDHWFEAILGVLTVAFAPAKFIGKLGELLARIPLVGSLLKWFLEATVSISRKLVDAAASLLGAFAGGLIGGIGRVFPTVGAALDRKLLDLVIRLGVAGGKMISFAKGLPGAIGNAILAGVGRVGGAVGEIVASLFRPFAGVAARLAKVASDLIAAIGRPFANVGSLLFNAGRRVIQGFIDGIGSMFGSVKSKLGDLTGKLTSWKGPPATDARLLVDNGQLVMGGFITGLQSRFGDVRSTLQRMTADLTDVAGLRMGGSDFAQRRLGATPTGGLTVNGGIHVKTTTETAPDAIGTRLRNLAFTAGF